MVFNPDTLAEALSLVFTVETLVWMMIGMTVGIGVGAMPGLTASTGVALFLPLTFKMGLAPALGLLIGLYKGAVYGGSISAISFATPGTPEAAATVYDGYRLMQAGKGRKAILMALYASATADLLSSVMTVVIAPLLAIVALKFGPSERLWLMVLAVTLLGALSGRHLAKGVLSAAIGLFVGTIGSDPVSALPRNTFGLWWLSDGINLIPLVIGIFAMGRMFEECLAIFRERRIASDVGRKVAELLSAQSEGLSFREYLSCWREMGIGLFVGAFVGMLPGLGATVGAFLSYGVAKQAYPHKKIGTGVLYGVAAAESGNNATVGPALIPLLAFGIPGSSTAALIGGALTLQGADPNPRLFELHLDVVYALFLILLLANVYLWGIGRVFAFVYAKIGQLPRPLLVPLVMLMAIIGSYGYQEAPYDVVIMLAFGVIGFGMRIFGIPEAPMVITFLIAPMLESSLRGALLINQGDWLLALFHSPLAIGLAVASVVLTYLSVRLQIMERVAHVAEEEAAGKKAAKIEDEN